MGWRCRGTQRETESTAISHGDHGETERHRGNREHGEFATETETTEVSDWVRHGGNGEHGEVEDEGG